jgi:hyperosmotically inducible protein
MKTTSFLAAAMIISSGLTMGCATAKQETRGETAGELLDDASVTTKINALIVGDKEAHFFKIDVTTTQGDVVLQGFVKDKVTEDRLVTKIEALRGVKSVKSLLRIEEKQSSLLR